MVAIGPRHQHSLTRVQLEPQLDDGGKLDGAGRESIVAAVPYYELKIRVLIAMQNVNSAGSNVERP